MLVCSPTSTPCSLRSGIVVRTDSSVALGATPVLSLPPRLDHSDTSTSTGVRCVPVLARRGFRIVANAMWNASVPQPCTTNIAV